jgi:ankyrin repeat protein
MVPDEKGNNPMHFAALADNPEVVSFFVQQTRGFFADNVRLLECRNSAGETPLLRAMTVGVIPVIRVSPLKCISLLIDHDQRVCEGVAGRGLRPLRHRPPGKQRLHFAGQERLSLVLSPHVLLHQVSLKSFPLTMCPPLTPLSSRLQGPSVALELMSCVDNEGHSPLDWAADAGDVNLIEYLIRKGNDNFLGSHLTLSKCLHLLPPPQPAPPPSPPPRKGSTHTASIRRTDRRSFGP